MKIRKKAIAVMIFTLIMCISTTAFADYYYNFNYGNWPIFLCLPANVKPDETYITSVAGKASTDKAAVIAANGESVFSTSTGKYLQYNGSKAGSGEKGFAFEGIKTFETNIYMTGNGKIQVAGKISNPDFWLTYLEIRSDGTLYVANGSGALTQAGRAALGQWHKFAVVFYEDSACFKIYFDGEQKGTVQCALTGRKAEYIKYVLIKDEEDSVHGRIAIDDLGEYSSEYNPDNDKIGVTGSADDIYIDNVNKIIYYDSGISALLMSKVLDITDAQRAVKIDENTILLVSSGGSGYNYYRLNDNIKEAFSHNVVPVSLVQSEGILYARAETEGLFMNGVSMFLCGYGTDGKLLSIEKCDIDKGKNKNLLKITKTAEDNVIYKAFLWEENEPLSTEAFNSVNEGKVLLNTGFEDGERNPCMIASSRYENELDTLVKDSDTVVRFNQKNSNSFHLDAYPAESYSDYATYETDFCIDNNKSEFNFELKDTNSQYSEIAKVSGNKLYVNNNAAADVENGKWYTISASYDFKGNTRKVYLDGKLVFGGAADNSSFRKNSGYVSVMRIRVPSHTSAADYSSFSVDNIRAYEEKEPCKYIGDFLIKPIISDKSVFTDTDYVTKDEIYEAYKSVNKSHPRIQAVSSDFDKIKSEINTNSIAADWSDALSEYAESASSKANIVYSFKDSNPMLLDAQNTLNDVYTLCMAYKISGNKAYLNKVWNIMNNIGSFGDWMPSNHLTVAEMSTAAAVAYDWLYDDFTDEQRKYIEEAVYKNAIYDYILMYRDGNSPMANAADNDMNHSVVCNSGAFVTAMAFMDVYPEECKLIAQEALRGINKILYRFAPNGAWFEGPGYWKYTMQYLTKLIQTAENSLGTDYDISKAEGIPVSQKYILAMQSDIAMFNYGDAGANNVFAPEVMYLSKLGNDAESINGLLKLSGLKFGSGPDYALALLWYDGQSVPSEISNKDFYFPGEEVASMRDSWNSTNETYLGIRAGKPSETHSDLDAGTFVFDSSGVRWAKDYGAGDYGSFGYWDNTENGGRWKNFTKRAEAHNILVINPGAGNEFPVNYDTKITHFESNNNEAIAVMNLTSAQSRNATKAIRGFFYTDNRKSVVVRDEVSLKTDSELYWFMQTDADVAVKDNGAVLSYGGKKMNLEFVTNAESSKIYATDAVPLESSDVVYNNAKGKRIAIKLTAKGDVNITVKLSPDGISASDVAQFDKPIDTWASVNMHDMDIVSSNSKVLIDSDNNRIAVEQLPFYFNGYSLKTQDLMSALSSNKYMLSYVDSELVPASKNYFTDGYIKAINKNNSDDVKYIPVVPYKKDEKTVSLSNCYFNNQGGSTTSIKSNIGGRGEQSYVITPPDGGSTKLEGVTLSSGYDGAGSTVSWTAECDIYAEGDSILFAHGRYMGDDGRTVFKWKPDGTVQINKNGTLTDVTTAERGKWHKLALSYSSVRNRVIVTLDGVIISTNDAPYWTDISAVVYGTDPGSVSGLCAFSEVKVYRGYYYPFYFK